MAHDPQKSIVLKVQDINELSQLVIKARLAAKLTQNELAKIAGLSEDRIKSYEENDYKNASLLEFQFILNALEIEIQEGEFIVALNLLRRTLLKKENLL